MPNWTRDELLAALNLYHQTPFGRQHRTRAATYDAAFDRGLNGLTADDQVFVGFGYHGCRHQSRLERCGARRKDAAELKR